MTDRGMMRNAKESRVDARKCDTITDSAFTYLGRVYTVVVGTPSLN